MTFLYPSATITIEIILCEVNEMEQIYTNTAKMLKAISDPKRLQIVDMLSCGELCACKILEAFHITQPTLSHDMKLLVEAGLVNDRREGKNIYYSLNTVCRWFLIRCSLKKQTVSVRKCAAVIVNEPMSKRHRLS